MFGIFAFIDGTARAINRPGFFQRLFYSGHKRNHVLQFLSVSAPDGMLLYTYGPTGVHNDNALVGLSGLASALLPFVESLLGHRYVIYGDPIFGRGRYITRGFERVEASPLEHAWNKGMNAARVSIEHIFGIVVNKWAFIDFAKQQKLRWTRPARAYLNAQFLTHCHNCLHPNKVSQMFDCAPPSLREYLSYVEHENAPEVVLEDIDERVMVDGVRVDD